MKRCFKCLCELPLAAFYKHARMGDGHLNKCKACTKKDVAEHRQANLEQVRQYDKMRASQPHRIALRQRTVSEWRAKHPDRRKAQSMVRYAITTGALVPWPVCEIPTCNKKPEAHHPDYSLPLLVVWLCSAHHKQAHALARTP
jgi:hypothetical protein